MKYSKAIIGERIKKERKLKGWKQQDLLISLSRSEDARKTVTNWENGKTLPPLDDLLAMCGMFECELGYLLGEFPEHTREASDLCAATGLSEQAARSIIAIRDDSERIQSNRQNKSPEDATLWTATSLDLLNSLLENDRFFRAKHYDEQGNELSTGLLNAIFTAAFHSSGLGCPIRLGMTFDELVETDRHMQKALAAAGLVSVSSKNAALIYLQKANDELWAIIEEFAKEQRKKELPVKATITFTFDSSDANHKASALEADESAGDP